MKLQRRFLTALSFLTRMPTPAEVQMDQASLAESPPIFPAVGGLLGLAVAALDWGLRMFLPSPVVAVVDLIAAFLLTGGIHMDGLLDTADGLFSGGSRERALEVMRDSRVGAMGASAGALLVGLKAVSIASLAGDRRFQALILAPVLGRYAMVVGITAFPYARVRGGLGTLFKARARTRWVVVPGLFAAALAVSVAGAPGGLALVASSLFSLGLGKWVTDRLGGLTGDVYGALCEIAEAAVYLVFAARW